MSDPIPRLNAALEGRYAIEREVGEGGMATVYLADDLRHGRKVALKVLKPDLAAVVGAERFLAEIKTTATLHHPHILPLFDSGEADGFLYFVMPFVEGETLRERIDREKQLPVDEAVRITTAVTQALQHAHERGVIHRDIKPANILLQDGQPVVADFGIALAVGAAGGSRLTETGLSVGTPYYMSPEQATGDHALGPATDVYALSAVLFEMLTGDPPYVGSTAQAVLGQILAGDTVSAIKKRRSIPAHVDAAIGKGLEKLPADRFAHARDFAAALNDPTFRHRDTSDYAPVSATGWSRATTAAAALAALFAAGFLWSLARPAPAPPVERHVLNTEGLLRVAGSVGRLAAIAPDGSSMVLPIEVNGRPALAVKMRGAAELVPIPGTEGVMDAVYSPDGLSILYATPGELHARPLIGGAALTLASDLETANRVSLDWLDDGTILYERQGSNSRHIVHITRNGEEISVVWPPDGLFAPVWVRGLPGSRGALLIACEGLAVACDGNRSTLYAVDLGDGSAKVLGTEVMAAWHVDTGHVVYVRSDGAVFAAPFDLRTLEITGAALPLFEGVRLGANVAEMALGADGTLLYVAGERFAGLRREVVWVDRGGRAERLGDDLSSSIISSPRLSPDGRRLALSMDDGAGGRHIQVKELPDGALTRVTSESGITDRPTWSADGRLIHYRSTDAPVAHIRTVRSDGSSVGDFEILLQSDVNVTEVQFTPDGRAVVFSESRGGTGIYDIRLKDLETDSVGDLLATAFNERSIALSPDGRWLAYVSDEAGAPEVFVRPFPSTGSARPQISTNGGREPVWARNGRELFYREPEEEARGGMMVATYTTDGGFRVESRERLFDASPYLTSPEYAEYDVDTDGQRFVMISMTPLNDAVGDAAVSARLILVQNWFEELRERLGTN